MRNVEIYIKGRVQGVGFRYHTLEIAKEFNINGFVRNITDGSVYIQAAGTKDEVESFIAWCNYGPRMAFVESVKVFETDDKQFSDFSIR